MAAALAVPWMLGGCAERPDPFKDEFIWHKELKEDIAPKIRERMAKTGYCLYEAVYGNGHVFVSTRHPSNGPPAGTDRFALLVAAGLFTRAAAVPEIASPGEGVWYDMTELGRSYFKGGTAFCFGKRTFVRIADLGKPVIGKWSVYRRTVTYEYKVEDLPAFAQTDAFRQAFDRVPLNGATMTDTMVFFLAWKAEWELPGPSIET